MRASKLKKLTAICSTAFLFSTTAYSNEPTNKKSGEHTLHGDFYKNLELDSFCSENGYTPISKALEERGLTKNLAEKLAPNVKVCFRVTDAEKNTPIGLLINAHSTGNLKGVCFIEFQPFEKKATIFDIIESYTGINKHRLKDSFNVSTSDYSRYLILHEIAHCNKNQTQLSPFKKEVDSDIKSLELTDSRVKEFIINLRAGSHLKALTYALKINDKSTIDYYTLADHEHDTSLYLVDDTNKEAQKISELNIKKVNEEAFIALVNRTSIKALSKLTQSRVKQTAQAFKYFTKTKKQLSNNNKKQNLTK